MKAATGPRPGTVPVGEELEAQAVATGVGTVDIVEDVAP